MNAVAGGMAPVPLKMTGKLTYLTNEFGHLSVMSQPKSGRAAPMRKKKTRPLETSRVRTSQLKK